MTRVIYDLPGWSYFAETIAAVNRFVTAGLEGDLGGLAALGASGGEHLPSGSVTAAATTAAAKPLGLSSLTAFGTALGLVRIAFGLKELLVFGAERKGSAAIGTGKGFILKTHGMTSSLKLLVRVLVIQHLIEIRLRGFWTACNNPNLNLIIV
jgi:hypothetical protein